MEPLRCQNDSLSAYPDYLTFLRKQREDFGWLYEFMRRNESLRGKTRMVVAESSKRELKLKHYTDGTDIQEFLKESASTPEDPTGFRLVLLCYKESWSFDRTILKAIAQKYEIPPTFLWAHFCHSRSWGDEDSPKDIEWKWDIGEEIETPFLPSERRAWIELKTGFSDECLSALMCDRRSAGESMTMVIFLRTQEYRSGPFRVSCHNTTFPNFLSFSKPSKDTSPSLGAYYEALLQRISPEEIAAGNANPILYIVPYARLLALRISGRIKGFRDDIRAEERFADSVDDMSNMSDALKDLNDGLEVSIASLRRHPSLSSAYRELLRDYEDLLNDAKQTTFDFKGILTRKVSLLALKESKESIRQTQIVSRLSQLAFVFIPLTFVTSCFGMNLTVLGSGKGKTWVVCVIAAALTAFVLLVSLFSWRMAQYCSGVLEGNTRPLRILPRLAWYLPAEAMWIILFMMSRPSKASSYLGGMGLYYHLLPEGNDDYIDVYVYRPRIELSEFWRAKGEHIHKFFHTHGWKRKSFLSRLRQQ